MSRSAAEHWGKGDVYEPIVAALRAMGKDLDRLTIEDLAPIDQVHARGLPATAELADRLPVKAGHHLVDIGCGLGGPARYMAKRFGCKVSGIDITPPWVDAGNRLTALVGMEKQVRIELGDGQRLPYEDATFDGGYAQHVTMNVADRAAFYGEAFRVLKPGAYFALTEHGLGAAGAPHHPTPWSMDGSGAWLKTPAQTRAYLEQAGFVEISIADTGAKYVAGYRKTIERAEQGTLPPLNLSLLLGPTTLQRQRNACRNIEEGRTHPIEVLCRKPA